MFLISIAIFSGILSSLCRSSVSYETFQSVVDVTLISGTHASRCRYLQGIYLPEDVKMLIYTQADTPKNLNCTEGCDESRMMYRTRCDKNETHKSNTTVAFTCAYELTSPNMFLKGAVLNCTFLTTPGCISDKKKCQIDYALTSASTSPGHVPAVLLFTLLMISSPILSGIRKNI